MKSRACRIGLFWVGMLACAGAAHAQNKPPVIEHYPVTIAVRGQPFFVRAAVADDAAKIKSVTLYYTLSRDAAPFKIPLQDSGTGTWYGSVPENVLATAQAMSYYIEAVDHLDAATETPWYQVSIKSTSLPVQLPPGDPRQPVLRKPEPVPVAAPKPVTPAVPVAPDSPHAPVPAGSRTEGPSWTKPALIAGGAVLLVGGGYAIANSGGGGGGGGGGGDAVTPGNYTGTSTTCLTMSGESSQCETRSVVITIREDGVVYSDDLRPGQHLETQLSGNSFVLAAPVSEAGLNGEIQFVGTVVDNRIVGTVQGSAQSATNTGAYSGTFSTVLPQP